MYIYRNVPFEVIWRFGWKNILFFILYSSALCVLHAYVDETADVRVHLPFVIIGPIGVAVAIYSSFKNGQSYDRTWEARKNWGMLTSGAKMFANQLSVLLGKLSQEEFKIMIDRQIAYLKAHKLQLRMPAAHSRSYSRSIRKYYGGPSTPAQWEAEVATKLDAEEFSQIRDSNNKALQILFKQSAHLRSLHERKLLDEFRLMELLRTLDNCIDYQGKNERIKSTPFPRQYGFFSKSFIIIFILILPFGILNIYEHFSLCNYVMVVLLSTLISWLYITIELVGDYSEDPFENFITDVPMSALCNSLEIDLYEMMRESNVPKKLLAENGALM